MLKTELPNKFIFLILSSLIIFSCKKEEANRDYIIQDGLIAFYPFNRTSLDESPNNNHGVQNGVKLVSDRNGRPYSAFCFDGKSDIQIPNSSFFNSLDAFSICVWVYPTKLEERHNTILSKVNPERDLDLKILKDNMKFEGHFAYNPGIYYRCFSNETVALNVWTHIVFQWTGTKFQIYVNGNFSNEEDFSGTVPPWTSQLMAIGSMSNSEYFTGKIDNIRIYNRTLSNSEIEMIYKTDE